jgi:hypothetical protein
MIRGYVDMRLRRIPNLLARGSRARRRVAATACVLATASSLWGAAPAAALTPEQGTISVSGEGSVSSYPCWGCTVNVAVAESSGYVAGADAADNPFTVVWNKPGPAAVSLSLVPLAECPISSGPQLPTLVQLSGTISVSGATLVYKGASMSAVVTGSFTTLPLSDGTIIVNGVQLTAQAGSVSVSFIVLEANGLLTMAPLADVLCPTSGVPTTFAVNGTLLTAL